MMKTLSGKILSGIITVILITYVIINIVIWKVFDNSLNNVIINDLDRIKTITFNNLDRINNDEEIFKEDIYKFLPVLGEINANYNSYIEIIYDLDRIYTGEFINKDDIELIYDECGDSKSIVRFDNRKENYYATYGFPIYINKAYIGTLILQKSYQDEFENYKSIMKKIVVTELVLYTIMIGIIYSWLNKTTARVKDLSKEMDKFSKGELNGEIVFKGHDEISSLAVHFNEMKYKITEQMDEIYGEKIKMELLEKERKDFFNYATHEMKTPLTAIKGYGELLSKEEMNEEVTRGMSQRIVLEANRMNKLVENMLVVARGKDLSKDNGEEFDIKVLIEEVIKDFKIILQKENKKVEVDVVSTFIFGIKEEIRTVIVNLIDNGIKYSRNNIINIKAHEDGEYCELTFFNDIYELPVNIKENLLNPFIKYNYNDYKKVSSGLGLFICKELMEKNEGSLIYEIKDNTIFFKVKFVRK